MSGPGSGTEGPGLAQLCQRLALCSAALPARRAERLRRHSAGDLPKLSELFAQHSLLLTRACSTSVGLTSVESEIRASHPVARCLTWAKSPLRFLQRRIKTAHHSR